MNNAYLAGQSLPLRLHQVVPCFNDEIIGTALIHKRMQQNLTAASKNLKLEATAEDKKKK